MSKLSIISEKNASIKMSSREIAELCEKNHSHVLRDIRNMLDELYPNLDSLDFKGIFIVKNPETGLTAEIHLPKRETMILVSGYRIDLRAKIIDRLDELEKKQAQPVIPQTLPEALRLAADLAEKNQVLVLENKQKDGKITALESLFQAGETAPQFVKKLNGVNSQEINKFLASKGWVRYTAQGWRVRSKVRDEYMTEQTSTFTKHGAIEELKYSAVLLKKGASKIFSLYLKNELPMKKTWNGEFTQNKAVV